MKRRLRIIALSLVAVMLFGMIPMNGTVFANNELNEDSLYIGFSRNQFLNGGISNALQQTGFYIMPAADYKSATSSSERLSKGLVAYCFNQSYSPPLNWDDGVFSAGSSSQTSTYSNDYLYYTKDSSVSPATFAAEVTSFSSLGCTQDQLYERVVSVALNGYPYNMSGFNNDANGNQILSDDVFRNITQYAIWYFTDGMTSPRSHMTQDEKTVFDKLINSALSSNEIDENVAAAGIDMYTPYGRYTSSGIKVTSDPYAPYQHLLAVTYAPVVKTETTSTLSLTNTVMEGTDSFNYQIYLYDSNGNLLKSSYPVEVLTEDGASAPAVGESLSFSGGFASVTLGNGQGLTLSELPSGFRYKIVQTNITSYETTVETTNGTGATTAGTYSTTEAGTTSGTDGERVRFINTTGTKTLTIRKEVTSSQDQNTSFSFDLNLFTGEAGSYSAISKSKLSVSGSYSSLSTGTWSNSNGSYLSVDFYLKPGGYITITGLPNNFNYTIYEENVGTSTYDITIQTTTTTNGKSSNSTQSAGFYNSDAYVGDINVTDTTTDITFINDRKTSGTSTSASRTLTIGKTISGTDEAPLTDADKQQDFTFEIQLCNPLSVYSNISGNIAVTASVLDNSGVEAPSITSLNFDQYKYCSELGYTVGYTTVTLKPGQQITLNGLPYGYMFCVTELNYTGYTPNAKVYYGSTLKQEGENVYLVSGRNIDTTGTSVIFNNEKKKVIENLDPEPEDVDRSITLSKQLTAASGVTLTNADWDKDFTFKIAFFNENQSGTATALNQTFTVTNSSTVSGVQAPTYAQTMTFSSDNMEQVSVERNGRTVLYWASVQTITLKPGQAITLSDLPESYSYLIAESGYDGYNPYASVEHSTNTSDNISGLTDTVDGMSTVSEHIDITFTNEKIKNSSEYLPESLTVQKFVDGNAADKSRSFKLRVYLFKLNSDGTTTGITGSKPVESGVTEAGVTAGQTAPSYSSMGFKSGTNKTFGSLTLTSYGYADFDLKDNQKVNISELPVGFGYIVEELGVTDEEYEVSEEALNGTATATPDVQYNGNGTYYYGQKTTPFGGTVISFTNKNPNKLATVTKTVDGTTDSRHLNKEFIYNVYLYKVSSQNVNYTTPLTGTYEVTYFSNKSGVEAPTGQPETLTFTTVSNPFAQVLGMSGKIAQATATVSLKDGQGFSIEGLPEGYCFIAEETNWKGYDVDIYGYYDSVLEDTFTESYVGIMQSTSSGVVETRLDFHNRPNTELLADSMTLTLRKDVSDEADKGRNFSFTVGFYSKSGTTTTALTDIIVDGGTFVDGVEKPDVSDITFAEAYMNSTNMGVATITLQYGQTVTFSNLPAQYCYTILESSSAVYKNPTITTNDSGYYVSGFAMSHESVTTEDVTITYKNNRDPNAGSYGVILKKEVSGDEGSDPDALFRYAINLFKYETTYSSYFSKYIGKYTAITADEVTITGGSFIEGVEAPDLSTIADASLGNLTVTYDERTYGRVGTASILRVWLKAGQYIKIEGLPEDAGYAITEVEENDNFDQYTPTVYWEDTNVMNSPKLSNNVSGGTVQWYMEQFAKTDVYPTTNKIHTVLFNNVYTEPKSLTVSKTVTGEGADPDQEFTFKVKLYTGSASYPSAITNTLSVRALSEDGVETPDISGVTFTTEKKSSYSSYGYTVATIRLKAGQSVAIDNLPSSYYYEITEESTQNYTVESITATNSGVTKDLANGKIAASSLVYTSSNPHVKVVYTNQYAAKALTIENIVNDEDAKDKKFTYEVTLTNPDGTPFTGTVTIDGEEKEITDGKLQEIYLKDGETVTIGGIPEDVTYKIIEKDEDGYTTSVVVSGGENTHCPDDSTENRKAEGSLDPDEYETKVTFINNPKKKVATGISMDFAPYVLMFACVLTAELVMMMKKRRAKG